MIIFNYHIHDLLNNAQLFSLYKSNALLNQGNDSVVDDTVISDEDQSLSMCYLEEASTLVADCLSGYTEDLLDIDGETVPESYVFNTTYNSIADSIIFRVNMPTYFDEKVLKPLDYQIKSAMINFVLYRTAKLKGIEFQAYQSDYTENISKLLEYLQRRTKTVTRSYRFI